MEVRKIAILLAILILGFGIFWKESDHMWWDVYWSCGGPVWNWIDINTAWFTWQVNVYNSWCLFLSLKILCFVGIVATLIWYFFRPEPIFMPHTDHQVYVSYDNGKTWVIEEFVPTT